jgi:hypothetical protein
LQLKKKKGDEVLDKALKEARITIKAVLDTVQDVEVSLLSRGICSLIKREIPYSGVVSKLAYYHAVSLIVNEDQGKVSPYSLALEGGAEGKLELLIYLKQKERQE